MSKTPSMRKQVVDHFKTLECFGQSRYEAKQQAIAEARDAGATGWIQARVRGVYSFGSNDDYIRHSIEFTQWAKQNYKCKYISDTRPYVSEYLKYRLQLGHTAWTLQSVRSACAKLFLDPEIAKENPLPTRRKEDIKRSRGPKAMDKKFSEKRNQALVDFCRATGLRRHELTALKAHNVYQTDERMWVFVEQGKGGRMRTVPVLKAMQARVTEIIQGKEADDQLFQKIPVRADIHGYRREYAQTLYEQEAGQKYDPKNKNKEALRIVSAALGHNRLDVVIRNYLS